MFAASRSMTGSRSAVADVQWIGPWYPSLTSNGNAPQWSMCACETTAASTVPAGNPRLRLSFSAC